MQLLKSASVRASTSNTALFTLGYIRQRFAASRRGLGGRTHVEPFCNKLTLPAGIEDLREKREEVQKQIRDEEGEKAKLQQDLQVLTKRLAHINDGLARKVRRACSVHQVFQPKHVYSCRIFHHMMMRVNAATAADDTPY